MKKLLYSSVVLTVFSLSIILFQISCSDDAVAKDASAQNKFIYSVVNDNVTSNGIELWIANNDGTDAHKISIIVPSGQELNGSCKVTANGQSIIYGTANFAETKGYIYSCNLDGSNLKLLVDGFNTDDSFKINATF